MNREEKKLEAAMKKEAIIRFCKFYKQGRGEGRYCMLQKKLEDVSE
jgi:hypothetical protein